MPLRKEKLVQGEYYHVYSRTLLNIPIFKEKDSAQRILQAFLLANSTKSTQAFQLLRNSSGNYQNNLAAAIKIANAGEKLVDVLCYAIMPDHYHLLLKEKKENGTANFIQKCNVSISKYFNTKNSRRGPLFESRFKAKNVDTNKYLIHLSLYIHLNPLDVIAGKEWRKHNLKNWAETKNKLLNYPWSSLDHFLKNKNNQIISGEKIITQQFDVNNNYESFLKEWSVEDTNHEFEFE